MTARVLVIDDDIANARFIGARLAAEYFEVTSATNESEALRICERGQCDVVLLHAAQSTIDSFAVCRNLKANQSTRHIPVLLITAHDQSVDRMRALDAGADDFLCEPFSEVGLLARVRSLARLKLLSDEIEMRAATLKELGVHQQNIDVAEAGKSGRVLVVDDRSSSRKLIASALADDHYVDVQGEPYEALFYAAEGDYDLIIVSLQFANFDGLRLCSQLRSLERTRNVPLLGLIDSDSDSRVLRGLEIGVSDYLVLPFDAYEVRARVQTQIRKKRYGMLLRESAPSPTETIVTDGLTKLYNRRYMESHLATLVEHAVSRGKPLSILMLDIDYFGSINDSYGDDAGDDTLREFAERLRKSTRGIDLLCRYGGEEFVAVLPETDMAMATVLAERIRRSIGAEAFTVPHGGKPIELTTSIGLACFMTDDTAESLLERARQAVDRAKRDGCNRVVADAA